MGIRFTQRNSNCLIVVGMHRSGTSCLIGNLQRAGLYLGKVAEWNKYNIKGNRENKKIVQLNESILSFNGGSWLDPPSNVSWVQLHIRRRNRIVFRFSLVKDRCWGFKDPRALFLLPFWEERIDHIQLVGTFRHPLTVAMSLYHRNRIPLENGLKMWQRYNMQLYNLLKENEFPLISFDVSLEEYIFSISRVIKNVGLDIYKFNNQQHFYDNSLIHHTSNGGDGDSISRELLVLYDKLNSIYRAQNNE